MKIKKKCVAMLLAGGQGSRLYALTQKVAKPAIPYGGKNRFIDFPLSNCINSGIDTVGVLTQYQPMVLNEYIGNGQPWDLDKMHGGVHVLPPYQTAAGASWYEGTANAIYQNMAFIERYDPEYVIVLGGDHIYKMDYSKMLDYHIANNADSTIAVIDVPRSEASRFGIMTCDEEGRIVDFTEKPKEPKSTLASMGIYVFSWEKLRKYLIENENANTGSKDFGKDIIPAMLANDERLFAYEFEGYWKDVGTLDSLWEANMDLLGKNPAFQLRGDKRSTIYARNSAMPSSYIDEQAEIVNAFVAEGSEVYGTVHHSIISIGCTVGEGALVEDSVVMPGVVIESGAIVRHAILGEDSKVCKNAIVGGAYADGEKKKISVTSKGAVVEANTVLKPGDML